jgi:putative selenate reductase
MSLGKPDSSGRPKPVIIENSEFELFLDTIIIAIGQEVDFDFIDTEKLEINYKNYETNLKNIFIGGDALRGASTLVNAVGDGRMVAEKITAIVQNKIKSNTEVLKKDFSRVDYQILRANRTFGVDLPEVFWDKKNYFDLTIKTLFEEQALQESARCLFCNEICDICVTVCPNRANISYKIEKKDYKVFKAVRKDVDTYIEFVEYFYINQIYQVLNISDFCNECGNCTTFCPTAGSPFKDKPRIYISEEKFLKSKSGYQIGKIDNRTYLKYKNGGDIETLIFEKGFYIYETKDVHVEIEKDEFRIINVLFNQRELKEFNLKNALIMYILLSSLQKENFYVFI